MKAGHPARGPVARPGGTGNPPGGTRHRPGWPARRGGPLPGAVARGTVARLPNPVCPAGLPLRPGTRGAQDATRRDRPAEVNDG